MSYLIRVTECEHGQAERHNFNTGYTPGCRQRVGVCPGGSQERITNMKEETDIVVRRVWAPGDEYLTAGRETQVFEERGFKAGMKVRRWVSEWEVVDTE